jgi:hypothetical protein
MSSAKLTVDEIISIMKMYDLKKPTVHCEYSEYSYVWECLKHLEFDPDYEYQFEAPPEYEDDVCDLYGQAVDRVAAFMKYDQPIIDDDYECDY